MRISSVGNFLVWRLFALWLLRKHYLHIASFRALNIVIVMWHERQHEWSSLMSIEVLSRCSALMGLASFLIIIHDSPHSRTLYLLLFLVKSAVFGMCIKAIEDRFHYTWGRIRTKFYKDWRLQLSLMARFDHNKALINNKVAFQQKDLYKALFQVLILQHLEKKQKEPTWIVTLSQCPHS